MAEKGAVHRPYSMTFHSSGLVWLILCWISSWLGTEINAGSLRGLCSLRRAIRHFWQVDYNVFVPLWKLQQLTNIYTSGVFFFLAHTHELATLPEDSQRIWSTDAGYCLILHWTKGRNLWQRKCDRGHIHLLCYISYYSEAGTWNRFSKMQISCDNGVLSSL